MRQTIEWHEQRLRCMEEELSVHIKQVSWLVWRIVNINDDMCFIRRQIEEAKRQGMDAFDADFFMEANLRRRIGER